MHEGGEEEKNIEQWIMSLGWRDYCCLLLRILKYFLLQEHKNCCVALAKGVLVGGRPVSCSSQRAPNLSTGCTTYLSTTAGSQFVGRKRCGAINQGSGYALTASNQPVPLIAALDILLFWVICPLSPSPATNYTNSTPRPYRRLMLELRSGLYALFLSAGRNSAALLSRLPISTVSLPLCCCSIVCWKRHHSFIAYMGRAAEPCLLRCRRCPVVALQLFRRRSPKAVLHLFGLFRFRPGSGQRRRTFRRTRLYCG